MIFSSTTFFIFFIALMSLYVVAQSHRQRAAILLAGSIIFYASWKLEYLLLLFSSLTINYYVYRYLLKNKSLPVLIAAIVLDLSVLVFYKYLGFLIGTVLWLGGDGPQAYQIPEWAQFVLPLGISFFTFQMLSALIDVYRGEWKLEVGYAKWCLYVSFFPQLIAGPIVRAHELVDQLNHLKPINWDDFRIGAAIFVGGLCKKVLLADNLGGVVDDLYATPEQLTFWLAWAATIAFALQIYFDFSGYSEMALGLARMFGVRLPRNFKYPYISRNVSEFWRRWHITLSQWLRDYLYIAMGGSRGSTLRTYQNLIVTMLLGGLWHGAGWTFVFWGLLHGLYLVGHRWLKALYKLCGIADGSSAAVVLSWLGLPFTFILINFTWVFFRAPDFETAWMISAAMLGLAPVIETAADIRLYELAYIALGLCVVYLEPWVVRCFERVGVFGWWKVPFVIRGLAYASLVLCLLVFGGGEQKFIYFDF